MKNTYEQIYQQGFEAGRKSRQPLIDELTQEISSLHTSNNALNLQKQYLEGRLFEANRLIEELTPWADDKNRSLV